MALLRFLIVVKLATSLDLVVPFRPTQIVTGGGAEQVEAWASLTRSLAGITNGISRMADKAAIMEGKQAGAEMASLAGLPQGVVLQGKATAAAAVMPRMPEPKGAAKGRRDKAMTYFTGQGWSREQAAGIVGNLLQESQLNPAAVGDTSIAGGSIGINQVNRDRQAALKDFARGRNSHWSDFDTQLAFVQHELTGSEKGAGDRLRAAKSVDEATAAIIGYERPQGWTAANPRAGHGWKNRLAYAQQVFGLSPSAAAGGAAPAPAAPAPAAAGSAAAGTPAPAAETGAPFRLSRSWTLRGQAHDDAALNIMSDRIEADALGKFEQIAVNAGNDPAAITQGFEAYRKSVVSQLPLEMQPGFNAMVARNQIGYTRQAVREHEAQLKAEAEASFITAYEAKRRNVVQMATRLGTDEQGADTLAAELASLDNFIASAQGTTPQERAKLTAELKDDVVTAQLLGQFENTPDAAGRATFAATLQESWTNGAGPARQLSPEAYARVTSQMTQTLARDETTRLKQVNTTERQVDAVLTRVKAGYAVPEAERASIKAQVASIGDPELAAQFGFFERLANWQAANRHATPEAIGRQITAYEAEVNARGATADDVTALDSMRGLQKATLDGLDKDPLGWAQQAGRIEVEPLAFTNQASMELSLRARAADATAVAQSYGRPIRFFRPEEREALTRKLADDPNIMVGFVQTLRKTLGDKDTPKALAELSKDAPVLAHVAGLSMMTSDDALMRETATALKVRQIDGYQPVVMPQGQRPVLDALTFLPGLDAAASKTAELLFDIRARQSGLDPAKNPEAAQTLWGNTISEVLGARQINGETYGGLADVNGRMTLVPTDMTAAQLQGRMDAINDATLADLPPIKTLNGYRIDARELATARLVPVAPNKYRVALGDPASEDPRYVMGEDNSFWILDVGLLPNANPRATGPLANRTWAK